MSKEIKNVDDKLNEQKTETFTAFHGAMILIGSLINMEESSKFFAVLFSAVLLIVLGMAQRTYIKILKLKGKNSIINNEEIDKDISKEGVSKETLDENNNL